MRRGGRAAWGLACGFALLRVFILLMRTDGVRTATSPLAATPPPPPPTRTTTPTPPQHSFAGRSKLTHRQLAAVLKRVNQSTYETHRMQNEAPFVWSDSGPEIPAEIEYTPVGFNFCFPHNSKYCPGSSQYYADGRLFTVRNPRGHVSVLEPLGGCGASSPASATARAFGNRTFGGTLPGCRVAVNAGFFRRQWTVVTNVTTNTTAQRLCGTQPGLPCSCLGNLVSQGRVVRNTTLQNANFGIRSGSFVTGYLSEEDVVSAEAPFQELMTGVLWLVRNGTSYVDTAARVENANTQGTSEELQDPDTPYTNTFIDTFAARTAIGHDAEGRLMILQIDGLHGRNWPYRGIDLHNMAKLLIRLGFQNAINLDGGGSSTAVVEDRMANLPSDVCPADEKNDPPNLLHCERPVSSIVCVHDAIPPPRKPAAPSPAIHVPVPSVYPSPAGAGCSPPGSVGPGPAPQGNNTFGYALVTLLLTVSVCAHLLLAYLVGVKRVDLRYLPDRFLCKLCESFCLRQNSRYSRVHKSGPHRGVEIPNVEDEEAKMNMMVSDSLAVVAGEGDEDS